MLNDLELLLTKSEEQVNFNQTKKLFITVGELENKDIYHVPINLLLDRLKNKDGLEVKFTEFKNGTHFTCPPEALSYGLKFIFKENDIPEP